MQRTLSQRTLDEGTRPSFCAGRKLGEVEQALLWTLLREDPQCPSRVRLDKVAERQIRITVRLRHVNRWRAPWQRNGRKGRPRQAEGRPPGASAAEGVRGTPCLACVGVHLFAHGRDQQEACGPVVAPLTQTGEA
jgi:hypothetical protein